MPFAYTGWLCAHVFATHPIPPRAASRRPHRKKFAGKVSPARPPKAEESGCQIKAQSFQRPRKRFVGPLCMFQAFVLVGLAHRLAPRPVVFVRAVTASASRRPVLGGAIGLDQHISGDPQGGGETANHAQGGRPAVPRYCEITLNFLSFGCEQAQGPVLSARRSPP